MSVSDEGKSSVAKGVYPLKTNVSAMDMQFKVGLISCPTFFFY